MLNDGVGLFFGSSLGNGCGDSEDWQSTTHDRRDGSVWWAFTAGLQFVVDEQNAKGGLLGRKVEVIGEDNEFKPDVAVRKAKKLILENKINFLANAMGSHIAIALNQVAASSEVLFFHYGAMADQIMGKEFNRYTFRLTTNIYNLAASQALLLATTPYLKLYSINMDFVTGHDSDKLNKELIKKYVPDATWWEPIFIR